MSDQQIHRQPKGLMWMLLLLMVIGVAAVYFSGRTAVTQDVARSEDLEQTEQLTRDIKRLSEESQLVTACMFEQLIIQRQITDRVHREDANYHKYPYPNVNGDAPPEVPEDIKGSCDEYLRQVQDHSITPLPSPPTTRPKA